MLNFLSENIGLSGALDLALMWVIIYGILLWFKKTRILFVVSGIVIVGVAYIAARELNLVLTTTLFHSFFAVFLIAIIIIFQEEIKTFFEQVASRSALGAMGGRVTLEARQTSELMHAVTEMAKSKRGALIILQGKDPLGRHLDGGENLDGAISATILESIFDPNSEGHDGAVIIEENRIVQFGAHLPRSKNAAVLGRVGTRHAAALGLAEKTDALCIVVSEEKGTISVARGGALEVVEPDALASTIASFIDALRPPHPARPIRDFFTRNSREKAIAAVMTAALWFIVVHESKTTYGHFIVPIVPEGLPAGTEVVTMRPDVAEIFVSGPKRAFYFLKPEKFLARAKIRESAESAVGEHVTRLEVIGPDNVTVEGVTPEEVTLFVDRTVMRPEPVQ